MKKVSFIISFVFISTQSFAGYILPDLSRSKSQFNLSPIAVGFSDRKSMSLTAVHNNVSTDLNNSKLLEDNQNLLSGSIFYSSPSFNLEVSGNAEKDKTNYVNTNLADSNNDNYNLSAMIAAPFTESIRGGLGLAAGKRTTNDSSVKTEDDEVIFIPAIGFKIQPNIAVGLGIFHDSFTTKNTALNSTTTEAPELTTNNLFAGLAYGVDQKIGEDGFGIEAVVFVQSKKSATNNVTSVSSGKMSALSISGNYIAKSLDFYFTTNLSTGKNYNETITSNTQYLLLKPEIMISNPFYFSPQFLYTHAKNRDSSSGLDVIENAQLLGIGVGGGMRVTQYDISLDYLHQNTKLSSVNYRSYENKLSGRFTFYY